MYQMRVGNQKGSGCGTCIKVCPWNKPYTPFHRAVGWTMRHSASRGVSPLGAMTSWVTENRDSKKWWLDLEDVEGDGVLLVPGKGKNDV